MEGLPTVGGAIAEYIAGLLADQKAGHQQELDRFARWFGPNRTIEQVTGITLETYQQQLERSGADMVRHLEPLKLFITFLQKKGYIADSIAKLIKIKRTSVKAEKGGAGSRSDRTEVVQITKEGYEQARIELDHLVNVVRVEVADELLEARRDKDIRENAAYDAAKNHQAHIESRIRDLERIVAGASIIEENRPVDKVAIGSTVVLQDLTHQETVRFTLVGTSEVDPRAGKISTVSPVGRALLEKAPGEVIEVAAPAGVVKYRVESIEK